MITAWTQKNNFLQQIGAVCFKDMFNLYKTLLYSIRASSNLLAYAWRGGYLLRPPPHFPEICSVTTPLPSGALSCHQKIWAARDISPWPPNPLFLAPYLSLCINDQTTVNLSDSSRRVFLPRTLNINTHILMFQDPIKCTSNFCSQNFALASRKSVVNEGRFQLKCDDTTWLTEGEVKGKLANGVGSQYSWHYLGTWCTQHYYRWCPQLGCQ